MRHACSRSRVLAIIPDGALTCCCRVCSQPNMRSYQVLNHHSTPPCSLRIAHLFGRPARSHRAAAGNIRRSSNPMLGCLWHQMPHVTDLLSVVRSCSSTWPLRPRRRCAPLASPRHRRLRLLGPIISQTHPPIYADQVRRGRRARRHPLRGGRLGLRDAVWLDTRFSTPSPFHTLSLSPIQMHRSFRGLGVFSSTPVRSVSSADCSTRH